VYKVPLLPLRTIRFPERKDMPTDWRAGSVVLLCCNRAVSNSCILLKIANASWVFSKFPQTMPFCTAGGKWPIMAPTRSSSELRWVQHWYHTCIADIVLGICLFISPIPAVLVNAAPFWAWPVCPHSNFANPVLKFSYSPTVTWTVANRGLAKGFSMALKQSGSLSSFGDFWVQSTRQVPLRNERLSA